MFEVEGVSVTYGRVPTVHDVTLAVRPGEVLVVLGPNGAGKTSMLRGLSGLAPAKIRSLRLFGEELGGLPPHERARRGMVHVPEGRHVFAPMTVHENLEMGAYGYYHRGAERQAALEEAYEAFPLLAALRDRVAGMLSGGEQQLLALARGLLTRPRLLMLDEPSLGLAPVAVEGFYAVLDRERRRRPELMVLLVEQNALSALSIASRALVLRQGRIVHQSDGADLLHDGRLLRLYLGDAPAPVDDGEGGPT